MFRSKGSHLGGIGKVQVKGRMTRSLDPPDVGLPPGEVELVFTIGLSLIFDLERELPSSSSYC